MGCSLGRCLPCLDENLGAKSTWESDIKFSSSHLLGSSAGERGPILSTEKDALISLGSKIVSPVWEQDSNAVQCYNCSIAFTLVERRHHCRRCGNVFCERCSSKRIELLLFQLRTPARVCDNCFRIAPRENEFVGVHLPRLRAGTKVRKRGLLGSTVGELRLTREGDVLNFIEEGGKNKISIPLLQITDCTNVSDITFAMIWEKDRRAEIHFDAYGRGEKESWVRSVREAVARSRLPNVAEEVEAERKRRKAETARKLAMRRAFESAERRRENNKAKREKLREKYQNQNRPR